jgi:hypothetical protein
VKRVAVVVAASNRGPQDVTIHPGTTANEVLNELGLQGYVLSHKSGNTYFGSDENIYSQANDGDLLYATTEAEVGVILSGLR